MKPRFKIGDRVKIIQPGFCVAEKDNGKGCVGTVSKVKEFSSDRWASYEIKSNEFKTNNVWWFEEYMLWLMESETLTNEKTFCPRCGKQLEKVISQGLLYTSQPEEIEKCKACGYC